MRAMILGRSPGGLHSETMDLPPASAGEVRGRVLACGVCRTDLHLVDGETARPDAACRSGARGGGGRRGSGAGRRAHPARAAFRRALAWLDLRRVPLLQRGPGESLRERAVHRLSPPRRLRGGNPGRRALLRADPRRLFRRTRRSVAVRRPHRLSQLEAGRGGRASRDLRIRRRGPHRRPGGPDAKSGRLCFCPSRRPAGRGVRPRTRRGLGRTFGPGATLQT